MQTAIGQSRTTRDVSRFNSIPTKYVDDRSLPELTKKILNILETRSKPNAGDTKFWDSNIAKVCGVSVRTVQRHVRDLEELGFVFRYTKRCYDKEKGSFYCIRVIRCYRMVIYNRGKVKRNLNWINDIRPVADTNLPSVWRIKEPHQTNKMFLDGVEPLMPKYRNLQDLHVNGVISPEAWTAICEWEGMAQFASNEEMRLAAQLVQGKVRIVEDDTF